MEIATLSRFGVLVAQLESIAASARQQPPDPLLCFDLLSELIAFIEEEPKDSIQQSQRKCEEALYSLLILGVSRPVRRLASSAMGRVIARGDAISIYSRVSSLQGWLVDSKKGDPRSCSGAAQCLGELYHVFGRRITSGLVETTNIAAKLMKFHEDFVRQDALHMLENALEGAGGAGAATAYSEAYRIVMRVGVSDKSFIVRLAAARCLKTFANIGGPGLGTTELENSIAHCVKALEDPISSVRDAFAEALGALLALAMNPDAQVKQKGKINPAVAKKLEDGLQKHLILPFTKASGVRAKNLRIGLALSWVFFLQVVHLKYHVPDSELENFALQTMDMLQGNASMDAHALACVVYILRVGITDQMTEPIQRSFLVLLARKLESSDFIPSLGVATLRMLSYLLRTLGEVPSEFKDILDNTVVAALSHSSLHVRIEAALTLRALAEVDPTCVGGLISYGVTTLYALRESSSMSKGSNLNLQLDSLHGQATVLAALVFISPKFVLGYPARLPRSVFEVSKKMLTEFSRNPMAATVEKEAGWLLLASLIASMPKEELQEKVFDVLLLWADPFLGNPESYIRQKQDLTSEIRVLTAGIEALTAFIKSYVTSTVAANTGGVLLQPVLAYLSGALSYISSLSVNRFQIVAPGLDLFTIRTLIAYQSVSDPMTYKSEHPQILHICSTPFSDPSASVESSCLRFLLDKRDACLGPWIPGRDWFEDELRAFDGGQDGIAPSVWEDEHDSFPQPESISKLLVNQKLLCFGTIFASQDNSDKIKLLNRIDQCLKTGKKQAWHAANITNACVALLAGLKALITLRPQTIGTEILSSIQSIFQAILADAETGPAQRRASSEGLGLLARLGNDIFTARMMRNLLAELVTASDPSYIGSVALSLGCIHRSAGGMALSTLVPATVNSISLLAKSSNPGIQLWALHALLLTIEAAGLSYISQVQATLFLAIEILLSEENGLADLRQELGRLINAIVAVLGPELAPGSTFFSRCKSFIAEVSSCHETSSLLESVRFTQQLALFAPQAVSVHSHVLGLLPTLSSRQPSLRHLAVSTLRHLIEKDPVGMVDEKIEENLFSMLNEETDSEIGKLVRATIIRLLYTSCPLCPSRWLAIFQKMVLSTSTIAGSEKPGNSEKDNNAAIESGGRLYYGEDDEGIISNPGKEKIQSSDSVLSSSFRREKHLRYRTRVFAAECLSYLPTAVGTDPTHFDLSLARRSPANESTSGDWLVLQLQELVSLAYQISTGPFEGMQPIGVRVLCIIMDKFGSTADPELPGHLLLEQYQAQLVSAVRSAVNMSSGPRLLEAGLQLATKILTSSIISGDRVALSRMFSLISRPLNEIKDLYYPSFAEWVACKIKIRLLAAHASIKCYVYQFSRGDTCIPEEYRQLIPLFSSSSSILGKYWISVLKDYIYICFQFHSKLSDSRFLDGIQSPFVSSKVQNCLQEAWLMILQATSLDAVPSKFEINDMPKSNDQDISKRSFISGYSMVRLELEEYQFLWGLALLILFQGQQPVMSHLTAAPLPLIIKKHNGDPSTDQENDFTMYEVSLSVLQSLSRESFFLQEYLTLDLCQELLQVLIFVGVVADSWNSHVVYLLSQIVHFCPDGFFEAEHFTAAVTELYFKCFLTTFISNDPTSQDLLSKLYVVAGTIARRMNHKKNQMKLMMAFLSISCELFKGASTNLFLPRIISFLQNILPFLKKYIGDGTDIRTDDYTSLEAVLGAWANMLVFLSQDCIKRTHLLENTMSDSSKLLGMILAFCLEEIVSLARLVHLNLQFQQENNSYNLLYTVFSTCIKCMRDTLYEANTQVQTVGLQVLKSIAQRQLAEGPNMKNYSFSLFFVGEFFGDIFYIIQHTWKQENISGESVPITEECLRLLLLFYTLSKESECLREITMLLLEALLMVFSVSNESYSQEIAEVKNTVKRLVSHLVQIPSFAVQIKDVMLSMPVSLIQKLQDMIRASVAPSQNVIQTKFSVQPKPSAAAEVHQSHALGIEAHPKESELKDQEQDDFDDGDNDDDDWDAFQSLPANNNYTGVAGFTSELHADMPESNPNLICESSVVGTDDHFEKNSNDTNKHMIPAVSEDASDDINEHMISVVSEDANASDYINEHMIPDVSEDANASDYINEHMIPDVSEDANANDDINEHMSPAVSEDANDDINEHMIPAVSEDANASDDINEHMIPAVSENANASDDINEHMSPAVSIDANDDINEHMIPDVSEDANANDDINEHMRPAVSIDANDDINEHFIPSVSEDATEDTNGHMILSVSEVANEDINEHMIPAVSINVNDNISEHMIPAGSEDASDDINKRMIPAVSEDPSDTHKLEISIDLEKISLDKDESVSPQYSEVEKYEHGVEETPKDNEGDNNSQQGLPSSGDSELVESENQQYMEGGNSSELRTFAGEEGEYEVQKPSEEIEIENGISNQQQIETNTVSKD